MLNYIPSSAPSHPVDLNRLAGWLNVLAEPKRLLIYDLLMEGARCNCELGELLNLPPNLISHHLGKLRAAGLIDADRHPVDARWIFYSVNRFALDELNTQLSAFIDPARIGFRQPNCGPLVSFQQAIPTSDERSAGVLTGQEQVDDDSGSE